MVLDTSLHKVCPDYPLGRLYYTFMGIIRTEFLCFGIRIQKEYLFRWRKSYIQLKD